MTLSFSSSQQSLPELFAVDRGHVSVFSTAENSANNRNVQNPKTINNQSFIMGFFFFLGTRYVQVLEFGKVCERKTSEALTNASVPHSQALRKTQLNMEC
jgi:hypothetical protein